MKRIKSFDRRKPPDSSKCLSERADKKDVMRREEKMIAKRAQMKYAWKSVNRDEQ